MSSWPWDPGLAGTASVPGEFWGSEATGIAAGVHTLREGRTTLAHWKAMEWQTSIDDRTGIRVYRLAGILTDANDSFVLIEQVCATMKSDPHPVLLGFTGVEQLTSAGVGMVATIYTSAKNAHMPLALCGLSNTARVLLQITHLLQFIKAFDDEKEALAAYVNGRWEAEA